MFRKLGQKTHGDGENLGLLFILLSLASKLYETLGDALRLL